MMTALLLNPGPAPASASRFAMPKRSSGGRPAPASAQLSIVDRAIAVIGQGPAEFARRLSEYAGKEISRQTIYGCQLRGVFSRELMPAVAQLTGIPLADLITAKPKPRDESVVERAIRLAVPENPSSEAFAQALSEVAHRKVSRQMVSEWRRRGQIPLEYAGAVNMLTKISVVELVAPKRKSS